MNIQAWKRNNPKELSVPSKQVQEIYELEFDNFENVRQEIFKLITGQDLEWRECKRLMLKAYLEFSAIADGQYDDKGELISDVKRSRWPDLVSEC